MGRDFSEKRLLVKHCLSLSHGKVWLRKWGFRIKKSPITRNIRLLPIFTEIPNGHQHRSFVTVAWSQFVTHTFHFTRNLTNKRMCDARISGTKKVGSIPSGSSRKAAIDCQSRKPQ